METSTAKECSALGGLFQAVINDLKVGMPLWEDFLAKAAKLHSQLKATILTTTSFLDAFQKVADLATNTRGSTKDIGTALTRICLRQRAVEARMKTFTSALMECFVTPLQDKMEDWKKTVAVLDKDHAKEYKRVRQEIKKKSSDTIRLQKKVRKGKCEIQRSLDSALIDVNEKFFYLEETEKQSVRTALIEERSRFCLFVACLKPVVDEEVAMLGEITHLQEIMEQLHKFTADPFTLTAAGEQLINEVKGSEGNWSFQTPPSSPSSIGSRKSSMCSISSINSSSSGSTKSHSPSHHLRFRANSQQPGVVNTLRLCSLSSQDSGFTSQDTLYVRPHTPPPLELLRQMSSASEQSGLVANAVNTGSTPSSPCLIAHSAAGTWPNLPETVQRDKDNVVLVTGRPHTISSTYEHGHQRPPLTVHTFEPLEAHKQRQANSMPSTPQTLLEVTPFAPRGGQIGKPELPLRGMERPKVPEKSSARKAKSFSQYSPLVRMSVLPDFNQPAPNQIVPQPVYMNLKELSIVSGSKTEQNSPASDASASPDLPDMRMQEMLMQRRKASVPELSSAGIYCTLSSGNRLGQNGVAECDETAVSEFVTTAERLEDASKYCTIPRYASEHLQFRTHCNNITRPSSTAEFPTGTNISFHSRTGSLRRTSSQTYKPPPPIRRTSSISSQHAMTVVALRSAQSAVNKQCDNTIPSYDESRESIQLPVPPDVFDEEKETISQRAEANQIIQNVNSRAPQPFTKAPVSLPVPVPPKPLNPGYVQVVQSVAMSAAAKAREKQQKLQQQPSVPPKTKVTPSNGNTVAQGAFFQNLNAKLQQHVQKNSGIPLAENSTVGQEPVPGTMGEEVGSSRQSFKEALNAKLAQQHGFHLPPPVQLLTPQHSPPTAAESFGSTDSAVQGGGNTCNWLSHRLPYDPVTCHESLLDQIKRGTTLRKTLSNDRSAPKIQ